MLKRQQYIFFICIIENEGKYVYLVYNDFNIIKA